MKSFPSLPHVDDAPADLLESGHLWLLESVQGAPFRFRLLDSGVVQFGDADRVYDDAADLPAQYGHAVRHIRERLDREALRAAVDDVEAIVFFGTAMQYRGIDYDWERTPSFLGSDVWSADAERFRPPDAVDGIFRRLGLDPINAVEQELPARDFDPKRYEIPQSAWYDGPAAGIVIRDKQGHRAELPNPDTDSDDSPRSPPTSTSTEVTAADLAASHATDGRMRALAEELAERNRPVTADALYERVCEAVFRVVDPHIFERGTVDRAAVREELAALTRRFLDER
ncbi:MAG: hypothetical protein ACOC0Z_01995 [Halohasta sp.]